MSASSKDLKSRLRHKASRALSKAWLKTGSGPVGRLFHYDLVVRTANFGGTHWLGTPIWQNVLDVWTIQETIAEIKPGLLIETGTHKGGSALFYAQLMDLIGHGEVMTVDIIQIHDVEHPRITFVHGSSTDPEIAEQVRDRAARTEGPVMVILDGNHDQGHVAQELEIYAPLVTPGSYLLSQDGVIDDLRVFRDSRPGPLKANLDFLERHPEFDRDEERERRFNITHHPAGWMRRR